MVKTNIIEHEKISLIFGDNEDDNLVSNRKKSLENPDEPLIESNDDNQSGGAVEHEPSIASTIAEMHGVYY